MKEKNGSFFFSVLNFLLELVACLRVNIHSLVVSVFVCALSRTCVCVCMLLRGGGNKQE